MHVRAGRTETKLPFFSTSRRVAVFRIIAGRETWEDIADYISVKRDWFRERLHMKLENGIPSHDTVQHIWGIIKPEKFKNCFRSWVSSVCGPTEGDTISIDGKTLKQSRDSEKRLLHMVSAWVNKNQLDLGQICTDEKSNETTAVRSFWTCSI